MAIFAHPRVLQLGSTEWRKFENAIKKSIESCKHSGNNPNYHFVGADKPILGGKGGGEEIEYGHKGKGVTSHVLTDGQGNPIKITSTSAAGDERQQVKPLLKKNHSMVKTDYWKRKDPDIGS